MLGGMLVLDAQSFLGACQSRAQLYRVCAVVVCIVEQLQPRIEDELGGVHGRVVYLFNLELLEPYDRIYIGDGVDEVQGYPRCTMKLSQRGAGVTICCSSQ